MTFTAQGLLEDLLKFQKAGVDLSKLEIVVLTEDAFYDVGVEVDVGDRSDRPGERALIIEAMTS